MRWLKIVNNLITPPDLAYSSDMPRRVYYRISDRLDGRFDAVVTIEPDTVIRRDGFDSIAELEEWIDGLRVLMAALGAPVAQGEPAGSSNPEKPVGPSRPGRLRTAR
ncbi:hypothetical protein SAMN02799622_03939 [Methylobacterium sp. UNC378MF]|nr:hypothetical protein SAMN02799622_03939 [Methylobacterium sp. UNC378MF]